MGAGFNKIFRFTLKPNTYIIATGGLGEHVGKFLDIIQKQPFPVSIDKASLFVDELQNILLANKLDKITLLVAGVEDDHNLLARVKMNEKQIKNKEGDYSISLPDSANNNLADIQKVFNNNVNLLPDDPLKLLTIVQKKVAEIDENRFVNTDFYYSILRSDGSVVAPELSKDGYKMK